MSLQFSECHTKIRHVDAHATLSDGVVVQVLGELSNNGQPMRKFMQTFVLAPEVSTCTSQCCSRALRWSGYNSIKLILSKIISHLSGLIHSIPVN